MTLGSKLSIDINSSLCAEQAGFNPADKPKLFWACKRLEDDFLLPTHPLAWTQAPCKIIG